MKKNEIRNISIEDFKATPELLDYVDDDIVIVSDTRILPFHQETVRLDCLLFAYCTKGQAQLEINNKTYYLTENTYIILLPTILLHSPSPRKSYNLQLWGFSPRFLRNMGNLKKDSMETAYYLYNNPVLQVQPDTDHAFFEFYKKLITMRSANKDFPLRKKIIHYLLSALFCEIIAELTLRLPPQEKRKRVKEEIGQAGYIFKRFMDKVMKDNGTHRSVSYYADQLCYSPKYLSTIIKSVCGKSPLHIINEHAMELIKDLLKNSELSMKEIADQFEFSTPSCFGKFVKAHLNMSPQEYRKQKEES